MYNYYDDPEYVDPNEDLYDNREDYFDDNFLDYLLGRGYDDKLFEILRKVSGIEDINEDNFLDIFYECDDHEVFLEFDEYDDLRDALVEYAIKEVEDDIKHEMLFYRD